MAKITPHHYEDACPIDISDEDVMGAMKEMPGYLDITPGDFKEVYRLAFRHAQSRLTHNVRAGDVMTSRVISVEGDTSLTEVAELMAANDISGVPVTDKARKVIGILSERDFLFRMGAERADSFMGVVSRCLRNTGCLALSIRAKRAQDIMTSPAITVPQKTSISEIAALFAKQNINRTPVTDASQRLLGMVTRSDLIQASCAK